jgi:hypothetical protein
LTHSERGPSDGVLLRVEEIKPSGKTLEDLADPSKK